MKNKCITLALLLFLASFTIGQNTAAVRDYLGARYDLPAPAGEVRFFFQKVTLSRTANGRATWGDVLKAGYFADSGPYGLLQAIYYTEGGKLVPAPRETPKTESPAMPADPVRPRTLNGDVSAPQTWAIDSLGMAMRLESVKRGAEEGAKAIGGASGVLWDFWIWLFSLVLPFFMGFGIVAWFVSKVSAAESLISLRGWTVVGEYFVAVHRWSSFALFCDLALIAATGLIHVMVWLWASTHSYGVFIPIAFLAYFGARIVNWIIPNLPMSGTRRDVQTQTNHPRIG